MRTFKSLQQGLPGSRHQKWYFLLFAALTVLYSSCRKPEIEEQQPQILSKKSALVRKDMKISMDEIMAKLPATVIYSLGNQFHMYTEKAQWRNAKDGLLVRVPINERQTKYIYALKPYGKPEQTNVYIVQYIPEAGNRPGSFNGKMLWLDMQNMSTYGLQYRNGTIVSRKNASVIAAPTWEAAAIEYGYFRLNKDNTISIRQGEVKPPPAEIIMAKFTANPKGNDPHSLEQWLIDLWWWFRDKFGYKNDAPFTENGPIGGNGGWTGPSGGINYGPVGGDGGPNPGDYGGGGWSDAGYSDPNNGNNNGPVLPGNAGENASALYLINSILNLPTNQQSWLLGHPETVSRIQDFLLNPINNLTLEQKKEAVREHILRMMHDPSYYTFVTSYEQQGNAGMWWVNEDWLDDPVNDFQLTPNGTYGQTHLKEAEKALIAVYPVQAYIIYRNTDVAFQIAPATGLPFALNGKQDAFRHAFFQAINVRDVPPRNNPAVSSASIVRAFAEAHETETPTEALLEKQMDLFNNEVGISFSVTYVTSTTTNAYIGGHLLARLNLGHMKYLKPLNPDGSIIPGQTQIFFTNQ